MTHQKTIFTFLFLFWIGFPSMAQENAISRIDTTELRKYLSFFASDELQGRKTGTAVDGLNMAANYLEEYAKKTGLFPPSGSFFQDVPMIKTVPGKDHYLELLNKKGKSEYTSKSLFVFSGVTGLKRWENSELFLAGFGEMLSGEDIKGKIIVVAAGNSRSAREGEIEFNYRHEMEKLEELGKYDPGLILLVTSPQDKENKTFLSLEKYLDREYHSIKSEDTEEEACPVVFITPGFADKILGRKGKYEKYLLKTAETASSGWEKVRNLRLDLQVDIRMEQPDVKNVIAMVEGSDPVLKNEYVIFVAHYDHLGMDEYGEVYNGADDNGSGTVALMEVAEAFESLDVKPKRSIVFLWVTCEELGHIGSRYYADNPVLPLENTVTAINLDMVGRVYEKPRDDVWKDSPKRVKDFDGLFTLSNDFWPELEKISDEKCALLGLIPDHSLPKERFLRSSDHYHFHKKGIPVLNYATGYHADYHKVGDEIEKINFKKIKRVADLCFLVGIEIANRESIKIENSESIKIAN